MEHLGKWIVSKGFKKLPKVQKIVESGHTADSHVPSLQSKLKATDRFYLPFRNIVR